MDLGIEGRWAIIGASSRGLGKGCAEALASAGCNLVLNGRNEAVLNETADAIAKAFSVEVKAISGDIGTAGGQDALFEACAEPDILITNNGGPPPKPFAELDRNAILAGVEQNMVTPIELIRRALPGMQKRQFGRIVNITSSSVLKPIPNLDVSSGARAGLTALLAGVAQGCAADNVTINNLLPGKMDTDRLRGNLENTAKRGGRQLDEVVSSSIEAIPAKRFGTADEFGHACAFLCSTHAGYITGQNILMDGGLLSRSF